MLYKSPFAVIIYKEEEVEVLVEEKGEVEDLFVSYSEEICIITAEKKMKNCIVQENQALYYNLLQKNKTFTQIYIFKNVLVCRKRRLHLSPHNASVC